MRTSDVATIMLMHWREASSDQYDQVRAKAHWDRDIQDGAKLHACGFGHDGMHILDAWESEDAFNAFFQARIGPAVAEVGIQGQPVVSFFPMHGVFAPGLGGNEQLSDL
jgi:hypothetical protein